MSAKAAILAGALALGATVVYAHGGHGGSHADSVGKATPSSEAKLFGRPGDSSKVSRTISVELSDARCLMPEELRVRRGETVRFVVKNSGERAHEFMLGDLAELKEHAEMMKNDADMDHEELYMAHVEPGETATIVWRFTRFGVFYYGCLIFGAFEAEMVGRIRVTK